MEAKGGGCYDVCEENGRPRYANEMPGLLLVLAIDAANCSENNH